MSLVLVITNAGRAALIDPANGGTRAVRIASVGVSGTAIVASPTTAALPAEVKRIATISGDAVGPDVMHMVVRDETMDVLTVRSIALYLTDGTLFAAYGQPEPIVQKAAGSLMLLAIDVTLQDVAAGQITFGSTNFLNPPATTERAGVVELATNAEAEAGIDATRALTPANVAAILNAAKILQRLLTVDGSGSGLDADLLDGLDATAFARVATGLRPLTQDLAGGALQLRGDTTNSWDIGYRALGSGGTSLGGFGIRGDNNALTFFYIGSSSAATNVLRVYPDRVSWGDNTLMHTANDGAGSGFDADLLDGQQGAWYADIIGRLGYTPLNAATYTAGDIRTKLLTVDGSGSGLDADLLDGLDATAFARVDRGARPLSQDFAAGSLLLRGDATAAWDLGYKALGAAGSQLGGFGVRGNGDALTFFYIGPNSGAANVLRIYPDRVSWGDNALMHTGNDGAGSGFDADLLDGQQGAWYADIVGRLGYTPLNVTAYTATDVLAKMIGVDGAGSGLDADLLDGLDATAFARVGNGARPLTQDFAAGSLLLRGDATAAWDLGYKALGSTGAQLGGFGVRGNANAVTFYYIGTSSAAANVLRVYPDRVSWGDNPLMHNGNDGAGSGFDADLLDGRHAADFALLTGAAFTGSLQVLKGQVLQWNDEYQAIRVDDFPTWRADYLNVMTFRTYRGAWIWQNSQDNSAAMQLTFDGRLSIPGAIDRAGNNVMDAGNDGAGSGFDADMVDGRHASEFVLGSDATRFGSNGNGYWERRPNGVIEQWGTVNGRTTEGTVTIAFPIAFTDENSINVQAVGVNTGANNRYDMMVQRVSRNANGVVLMLQYSANANSASVLDAVDWRAIGR